MPRDIVTIRRRQGYFVPASVSAGTAPTINATSGGAASSGTAVSNTGFASSANSILVAFIFHSRVTGDGSVTTISSVTDTVGLGGWTRRGTQRSFHSDGPGTPWCALDVFWTFSASSQAAIAVTANLAATADDLGIIVIAVNGCGNTSAPWDVNGSLPASISDLTAGLGTNSIPTVTGVSTTAPGTLICMFATNANSSSNPTSQTAQVLRRLPIKSHLLGRISPGVRSRPAHSPLRNPALRRRLGSRGIAGSHWQTRWLGPNGLGARGARQISTGGCKMTDDVEKAEHVLNNLRAKRDALVAHGIELGEERAKISFAAHTGDKGARQRLDKLNAEAALHESELRSLDAAIAEAGARVQQARTAEAAEKDKAAALGLRTTVKEIGDAMRYADSHLGKAIDALNAVNDALDRIHASVNLPPMPSGR